MNLPEDHYIRVEGHRIRYWRLGAGPPVVLLHGLGNSVLNWRHNVQALSNQYTVYALDLPGHGLSDIPPVHYDLPTSARFLNAFADGVGIDAAHVIGNSMGGVLAIEFALQFPKRVHSMVLIGSAGLGRRLSMLTLRIATLPILGEYLHRTNRRRLRAVINSMLYDPSRMDPDDFEERFRCQSRKGIGMANLAMLRYGVNIWGQRSAIYRLDRISEVHSPVLLVCGQQDPLFPVVHATAALERFPNARLELFEGAGHWPQYEHPDRFNRLVIDIFAADASESAALPVPPTEMQAS